MGQTQPLPRKIHLWHRLNLFRGLLGCGGRCPASTAPCGRAPTPVPKNQGVPPGPCPLPLLDFKEEQLLAHCPSEPQAGAVTDSGWGPPAPHPTRGAAGGSPGPGPEEKEINKRGG